MAVVEDEDPAVVGAVVAGAEDEDLAAVVAVAVVAGAGTATAAIVEAVAAATAAGNSRPQSKVARKPGSVEAPRFHFLDCQGTHYGLCFP